MHYCSIVFYSTTAFTIWEEVKNRKSVAQHKHFILSLPFFGKDFSYGVYPVLAWREKILGDGWKGKFPFALSALSTCPSASSSLFLLFLPQTRTIIHSSLIPLSSPFPFPSLTLFTLISITFLQSFFFFSLQYLATTHGSCCKRDCWWLWGFWKVTAHTWRGQHVEKVLPSEWCGWSREKSSCWGLVLGAPRSHLVQDTGKLQHLEQERHRVQNYHLNFPHRAPSHRLHVTPTETSREAWELTSAWDLSRMPLTRLSALISPHLVA